MELPESLHRWRDWLAWFGADLQPEVGALVRRLHPLLGAFLGTRLAGTQEPAGLGNLNRRGPYDRLLASEWLLAHDMPDEFLRRAAAGEHLFLAPPTHAPQADRLIVALFDAGPFQLGAPRLAHLALWILLARRARDAGGELRWGILQGAPALREATEVSHLRSLLKARTYDGATAEHLHTWQTWLAEHAPRPGECWRIGGHDDEGGAGGSGAAPVWTHTVRISPALTENSIDVHLRAGRAERTQRVALPEPAAAVRLLKGGFQLETLVSAAAPGVSPHRLATLYPPQISLGGTHVAVPMLDEPGVMLFHVPKAKEIHTAKARRNLWPTGAQPLAAAFYRKRYCALLSHEGVLHLWMPSHIDTRPRPSREVLDAPPGRRGLLPAARLYGRNGEFFCMLDCSGRLVYWRMGAAPIGSTDDAQTQCLATQVFGMAQVDDSQLIYLRNDEGILVLCRWSGAGAHERMGLGSASDVTEVLFGAGALWRAQFGACAVRRGELAEQVWTVFKPAVQGDAGEFGSTEVRLPPGWRAIGIAQVLDSSVLRLVTLDASRTRLALHGGPSDEVLYTSASPIVQHTVSVVGDLVALLTEDRTLIVYSIKERLIRTQVSGRGEDHVAA
ncbi:hypothetical protein ACS15_0120 [Ralstonia insidiosa]|uniref:Uncharacterized protein n=1 Tax=Ralstonia insidiosa TaxID=190721 RepID=A0AAC9BGY3_9RALS|nr:MULTISPECIES: hypothetical protein [Ralstonia]ANH73646.1 hypothetical protein ACS15_0120 [Ralstonia insidiosa]EPX96354.1 hypothetical protein C404_19250 [Ralstonia sp. AU12-08]MBY4707618.1 hypothetical protein [Ralstonia insidiosa]GAQ28148.1 hypothetical protein SAMD00023378_1831 [Ralstonia sp. NT80]